MAFWQSGGSGQSRDVKTVLLPCVLLLCDVKTVRLNVFPCVRATDAVQGVRRPFFGGCCEEFVKVNHDNG